jgi:hypothetical protein
MLRGAAGLLPRSAAALCPRCGGCAAPATAGGAAYSLQSSQHSLLRCGHTPEVHQPSCQLPATTRLLTPPPPPPPRSNTTCRFLRQTKANFYSNERQLHGSSHNPATAHVCGDFYSVIILRDPLDHVQSLLLNTYTNTLDFINKRLFTPWLVGFTLPNDFDVWRRMAPAVVNNYYTRTLLGK